MNAQHQENLVVLWMVSFIVTIHAAIQIRYGEMMIRLVLIAVFIPEMMIILNMVYVSASSPVSQDNSGDLMIKLVLMYVKLLERLDAQ